MGRIFDALQRTNEESSGAVVSDFGVQPDVLDSVDSDTTDLDHARPLTVATTPEQRLVVLDEQRSLGAEKIRILAARLRQLQDQRLIKTLLVTSTVKDEGKTVLSTNVAVSLARTKQRVLLIDGDCHQANAARLLGANGSPGLTDWWRSEGAIQSYLMRVNGLLLWFLPAGRTVEQPLEMLQSARLSDQVKQMSSWFDWVIIDSPPSAPLADAAVWGNIVDGIVLVTREGKTPKRLLRKVLDTIDKKKLLGIVLNDCSDPDQHYYMHYYNLQHTH
jgi:capsular exopolysaccharide synthesis family protein